MALKFTQFPVTPAQQQRIEEIGRVEGWSILPPSILDTIFPSRYLSKIDATIRVAEPTSSGGICVMFNSLRVDMRTRLIDQDPLAFFQNSTGLTAVGVHVHHGSWAGRSWEMSSRLWRHIAEQGVGGYFLANPPGNARSGTLDDLPKGSADALLASLTALRSL